MRREGYYLKYDDLWRRSIAPPRHTSEEMRFAPIYRHSKTTHPLLFRSLAASPPVTSRMLQSVRVALEWQSPREWMRTIDSHPDNETTDYRKRQIRASSISIAPSAGWAAQRQFDPAVLRPPLGGVV
jgi:hypothetical protein